MQAPHSPILAGTPDHPITITATRDRVRVAFAGRVVADTRRALSLAEASYATVAYIPREDVDLTILERTDHKTRCPYKGEASYYSIRAAGRTARNAIWSYEHPLHPVAAIAGYMAFYPDRIDNPEQRERHFAPEVCEFWQANRIPHSPLWPRVRFAQWLAPDSEENYWQRGNKEYSVESVSYELNSYGYRGPELKREIGERVAMFVGSSITLGCGMPLDDVWTSIVTKELAQRWRSPVRQCNLAWTGVGSDYIAMLVHQAVDVLKPDAVFVLWSFIGRLIWFANTQRCVTFVPFGRYPQFEKEHEAYLRLATDAHVFFNYIRNCQFVYRRLLRLGVPYYWGMVESFSSQMLSSYVPLERYVGRFEHLDSARDGMHPGRKSHARFADRVIESMNKD
jgi:uncharacterized protein (DUF427 family)